MMIKNDILVSICMITYNHEKYIREAIEGILMQKTSFPIELIIGEDCSTDRTREIVIDYANKNPEIIKAQLPEMNIGGNKNFLSVLEAAQGKYIAICEGDDYWTDPYKLQKQVEILEENNKVVAVITNSSICDVESNTISIERIVIPPSNLEGIYNLHDFFKYNHQYPTLTVVFRNRNMDIIISNMNKVANPYLGDWTLFIFLYMYGDFYFINQVTSAYRINPTSLTHTVNAVKRWEIAFIIRKQLMCILPKEYHKYLNNKWNNYFMLSMAYRKNKNRTKFIYYQLHSFFCHPTMYLKKMLHVIKERKK